MNRCAIELHKDSWMMDFDNIAGISRDCELATTIYFKGSDEGSLVIPCEYNDFVMVLQHMANWQYACSGTMFWRFDEWNEWLKDCKTGIANPNIVGGKL